MNFINFERRIDPNKGKLSYFPNKEDQSKVVNPKSSESESLPKTSNANSRTPTRANAATPGKGKNKLGLKVSKAIQGVARTARFNPIKTGLGLAVAGGLGYAATRALRNRKPKTVQDRINANLLVKKLGSKLRKMRSDKGRKRK